MLSDPPSWAETLVTSCTLLSAESTILTWVAEQQAFLDIPKTEVSSESRWANAVKPTQPIRACSSIEARIAKALVDIILAHQPCDSW